jgi:FkbM family methyltransferase
MKTLIEVGAYDGSDSLNYHSQGYNVITFEPKKDLYYSLLNKTKHLSNYKVVPKAVCLFDGTTQFNICKFGGASSILPFRSDNELDKTWGKHRQDVHWSGESYQVETTRLDTYLLAHGMEKVVIDFLHIDAQGVDLDVLKSLGVYIKNVKAGVVETVINPEKSIYQNQENNYSSIKNFLESNNFKIDCVQSNDNTDCEYNIYFTSIS